MLAGALGSVIQQGLGGGTVKQSRTQEAPNNLYRILQENGDFLLLEDEGHIVIQYQFILKQDGFHLLAEDGANLIKE